MKKKNKITLNCVRTFAGCVEWNLPPIACLGIQTGDMLDEVIFALVKKICEIAGDDLGDISLQCLIDKFNVVEPLERTVTKFLQLLIDNQCYIGDLITAINDRIDNITATNLILDLKCLATFDSSGNQIPYTTQTVLQSLITEACVIRSQIAGLAGDITDINIRIDNLPPPYVEPNITTCLFTNKKTSQAVSLLASDYCTYKGSIGTVNDINTAIARQCDNLNTEFASDANFLQSPTNLAQSFNNLWIAFCNRSARLEALEACACKITCKDVLVGFITTFNDDQTVTLKFTSGAGTTIPTGFSDCGSILTIKNDSGVMTNPIPIVISQGGETVDIDISMFEGGEYLTFSIDAALCGNGISCNKCVSKVVRNTSGCCLITNSGTSAITITYKTCGISTPPTG